MADEIIFRAVSDENWTDFESLFQQRGAPKSCWCTAWRNIRPEFKDDPLAKKHEMEGRIRAGESVGILGYLNEDPIAWCSVSPRTTYRSSRADVLEGDENETIWSIVCFFVMGNFRRRGLFIRLIEAAEAHATRNGATVLEAYPVDPNSPSYRFGGFLSAFEELGYETIAAKAHAGMWSGNRSSERRTRLSFASAVLFLLLLTGAASAQSELARRKMYPQFPCLPGEWPCTVAPQPKPPIQSLPDVRRVPQPPPFPDLGRRPPSPAYTPSPFAPYSTLPLQPGSRTR